MTAASHEIIVFSDASTLFAPDAVRKLVRHFGDPHVGVACGTLGFEGNPEFQRTEGVYWRYEKALRVMESRLGATLTASGAIYALRRAAWRPLTPDVMIDDFVVPFAARGLGYGVVFDPEARATDVAEESVAHEFARRVRLAVGSFRALGQLARVRLDAFTSRAFFSHKLLRWVLPSTGMTPAFASAPPPPWQKPRAPRCKHNSKRASGLATRAGLWNCAACRHDARAVKNRCHSQTVPLWR